MPASRLSRLVTLLLLCAVSLQAQQPEATFKRAITAYASASSISVQFDQTVTNPLTDRSLSTSGALMRKRPNLLSISFNGKNPDRIVSDGSDLWVYLPSSAPGQVIKIPAAAGESGMMVDPMGQILSAPAGSYVITDAGTAVIGGRATHAITLVPRSRASLFTKATLWIDDSNGLVRQLESTEPGGLVRKITVTRFRTNVAIPRSAFQFIPPPDTRIIDGSGMVAG
ncbi:MAG TPA: outer membrane lipoprotein carrier protein LolA [Gemmatimonadaceae bacterium]|jgi:outer membrane lipoprotein carrier protein